MSNSNGVVKAPISLAGDVYKVLGISAQNGVYDVGYACSNAHGKTNRFSFKKPISLGVLYTQTDDQFEYNNCGMEAVQAVIAGTPPKLQCEPWGYKPPTGGSSSPYRLADFDGYNHNAVAPVRLQQTEITYDKSAGIDTLKVYANFAVRDETTGEFLSYGDINNVEIPIDKVASLGLSRFIWWGLALVNGNEILVANSDNNIDQSDKGYDYSPGVVKLGDWKLGEYIQNQSAGKSVSLVPIINIRPEGGGHPSPIDKNGFVNAETALCFPDGKMLTINIIETTTGIFAQATWSPTGRITIYFRNQEIGYFEAYGAGDGYFDTSVISAASNVIKLEMAVHVSPKTGSFTIYAENWSLDFSNFPHDAMYSIGSDGDIVRCNGVTLTKGGTTSLNLDVQGSTTVYFTAEVNLLNFMQSFFEKNGYRGPVSLRHHASDQTAMTEYYTFPTTNSSL